MNKILSALQEKLTEEEMNEFITDKRKKIINKTIPFIDGLEERYKNTERIIDNEQVKVDFIYTLDELSLKVIFLDGNSIYFTRDKNSDDYLQIQDSDNFKLNYSYYNDIIEMIKKLLEHNIFNIYNNFKK